MHFFRFALISLFISSTSLHASYIEHFPPQNNEELIKLSKQSPLLFLFETCDQLTQEEAKKKVEGLLAKDPKLPQKKVKYIEIVPETKYTRLNEKWTKVETVDKRKKRTTDLVSFIKLHLKTENPLKPKIPDGFYPKDHTIKRCATCIAMKNIIFNHHDALEQEKKEKENLKQQKENEKIHRKLAKIGA